MIFFLRRFLDRLFRRHEIDRDVHEEIDVHIAMREEVNEEAGMSAAEARRDARRRFGNVRSVREKIFEFERFGWLEAIAKDIRHSVRGLGRTSAVSAIAILTIAIGVGAAGSMFGIMQNLILAPPPHVSNPEEVFRFHQVFPEDDDGVESQPSRATSYPFYERLRDDARTLASVAAYDSTDIAVGRGAEARMTHVTMVSAGFWRTLGVEPEIGRLILDEEAHPATGSRVAVLGHAFWRNRFRGRQDVLGETVEIKGQPYEIVGVLPRGFRGVELEDVDLWLPFFVEGEGSNRVLWHTFGTFYNLRLVVRLDPNATMEQATAEITGFQRTFLEEAYAPMSGPDAQELFDRIRRGRTILGPVTGALGDDLTAIPEARVTQWLVSVSFALLAVACLNVAGLLLLRAMRRRREIAVRLALGVSRRRLAAQLLTESAVLSSLGALAALAMILWGGTWLQRTILPSMAWDPASFVDPAVLTVAALSTLLVALGAGMTPLLYAKTDLLSALHSGRREGLVPRLRIQTVLLVLQGTLSVVLLVGAGLFLRSLDNAQSLDIGFDRDSVLAVEIDFSGTGRTPEEIAAFFEDALNRIDAVPRIMDASLARAIPLRIAFGVSASRTRGREGAINGPGGGTPFGNHVTPGFFSTTGMRMVAGDGFTEEDRQGDDVIVISETMARIGWPERSPLGECVFFGEDDPCKRVIGVVADAIRFSFIDEEPHPYLYRPMSQDFTGRRSLLVRTSPGSRRPDAEIRQALIELDPALPYVSIETLGEALDPQIRPWRLGASVLTAFGILAIVLAMVGLWSSLSYAVSQRRNEFAIRMAVGAEAGHLIRLVLTDGLRTALVTVASGVLIALAVSPLLAEMLFQVSPRDGSVLTAVAAGVLTLALLVSVVPAWRVSRIHPAEALRSD